MCVCACVCVGGGGVGVEKGVPQIKENSKTFLTSYIMPLKLSKQGKKQKQFLSKILKLLVGL